MNASPVTLWWHRFVGQCEHAHAGHMACESDKDPEQLAYEGRLKPYEITMLGCECKVTMTYFRSWDHDPGDIEVEFEEDDFG